jgi:hypothetical protein
VELPLFPLLEEEGVLLLFLPVEADFAVGLREERAVGLGVVGFLVAVFGWFASRFGLGDCGIGKFIRVFPQ